MLGSVRVVTPPAVEPVSLADVKAELGITDASQDARITRLIQSARELAEAYTNRAFITRTLELQMDAFPLANVPWWDGVQQGSIRQFASNRPVALPRPPAISIASVRWFDSAGDETTVDADSYYLDNVSEPARLVLVGSFSWPTNARAFAAVSITYDAGYGGTPAHVPGVIRDAIMAHVRDAIERPNASISAESIDNASVTYGATPNAATQGTGGPTASGGLRGEAAAMLAPYRVMDMGV